MGKVALVTGCTGQDGSHLVELLLSKGYEVHGLIRRSSTFNTSRLDAVYKDPHEASKLRLHYGDLCDHSSLTNLLNQVDPDEIYNLAAMSHVRVSFDMPVYVMETTAVAVVPILEAIRRAHQDGRTIKLYQASSSEMFGNSPPPQNESTPFQPRSPYAVAKVAAHNMVKHYREAYGIFACCGILFNHTGPRRGETFVTRKITRAVARIATGKDDSIYLGNLDAKRDWGYAPEYVEAMWTMLQQDSPDDYVIATGETHSVREFAVAAFGHAGLDFYEYCHFDDRYLRPTEVNVLCGDASRAELKLGWRPKTRFLDLVKVMVDADMAEES